MADLKREYVIPLRRKIRTAPRWRRSKKAVSVLKEYVRKHMKTEEVVLCAELNDYIWKNGAKNPPGKVGVTALKTEVAGQERTLVNLVDIGVDTQLKSYATPQADKQVIPTEEELKNEAKDAEVKEVEEKAPEAESKKEEAPKKETKAKVEKKEVKAETKEEKKNE